MNNLIATQAGQPATMSSREISDLVEARHNDVIATIERLFGKGLLRSSRISRIESTGGRPLQVYDLIERDTHLVVSGYSDEHRAKVIDRWQELEQKQAKPAELSRMDILQIAMEAEQGRIIAEGKLAIAAPKAEFVDKYVQSSSGSLGVREVCKVLGAKQTDFVTFLLESGFMYRTGDKSPLRPKAEHVHSLRFEARTGSAEHGDKSHSFVQYKFTAKGVEWIAGEWGKHKARQAK